jgi:hypothetical protein
MGSIQCEKLFESNLRVLELIEGLSLLLSDLMSALKTEKKTEKSLHSKREQKDSRLLTNFI